MSQARTPASRRPFKAHATASQEKRSCLIFRADRLPYPSDVQLKALPLLKPVQALASERWRACDGLTARWGRSHFRMSYAQPGGVGQPASVAQDLPRKRAISVFKGS